MISFWESESLLKYEYIVIGSGIVGLQAAIRLKEIRPDKQVLVLERGILPTGASTRNAGFACFGSLSELADDRAIAGEEGIRELFFKRKAGIQLLRNQLGDEAIGFEANGSHELLEEHEAGLLDYMDEFNRLLMDTDGQEVFTRADHKISEFGLNKATFKYCVSANLEGCLHTGKLMAALLHEATLKGVRIITGARVDRWEEGNGQVIVCVEDDLRKTIIPFQAAQVLVCTNAFSKDFFPELDIVPGRGQVILTAPIPDLKLKGIYHFDHGYYYFRTLGDRILFGGGRNLDFRTEETTEMALNQEIIDMLIYHLQHNILPGRSVGIDMQWAGIMAFGKDKSPILHRHSDRVFGAFRLGGMGVALGTQIAKDLVDLVTGRQSTG